MSNDNNGFLEFSMYQVKLLTAVDGRDFLFKGVDG